MPTPVFPQDVLRTVTLIMGMAGVGGARGCAGCEERLPVCSRAAGVKALSVRLELPLFPSSVDFSFSPPCNLSPKGREC